VPRWEAVIHHHLKRDKVTSSLHPQFNEIRHNPNGFEALMLLVSPCHPAFTDDGILIQLHPRQGKRTLDEHFRRCEFYHCCQRRHLNAKHDWLDDIHVIRFLDSCQHLNVLYTLYNQENHVPACRCKFMRKPIVATLKEHMTSPSFVLLDGRPSVPPVATSGGAGTTAIAVRPSNGTALYCFSQPSGGNGNGRGMSKLHCYECNELGHVRTKSPKLKKNSHFQNEEGDDFARASTPIGWAS